MASPADLIPKTTDEELDRLIAGLSEPPAGKPPPVEGRALPPVPSLSDDELDALLQDFGGSPLKPPPPAPAPSEKPAPPEPTPSPEPRPDPLKPYRIRAQQIVDYAAAVQRGEEVDVGRHEMFIQESVRLLRELSPLPMSTEWVAVSQAQRTIDRARIVALHPGLRSGKSDEELMDALWKRIGEPPPEKSPPEPSPAPEPPSRLKNLWERTKAAAATLPGILEKLGLSKADILPTAQATKERELLEQRMGAVIKREKGADREALLRAALDARFSLVDERVRAYQTRGGPIGKIASALVSGFNKLSQENALTWGWAQASGDWRDVAKKAISLRTMISCGLLGVGLAAGATTGLGALTFVGRRAIGGIGTMIGSYNLLRARADKVDLAELQKLQDADLSMLDVAKLEEHVATLEVRASALGEDASKNPLYKKLLDAWRTKLGEMFFAEQAAGALAPDQITDRLWDELRRFEDRVEREFVALQRQKYRHAGEAVTAGAVSAFGVVGTALSNIKQLFVGVPDVPVVHFGPRMLVGQIPVDQAKKTLAAAYAFTHTKPPLIEGGYQPPEAPDARLNAAPDGETPARVVGRPTAPLHEAAPPNRLVAPERVVDTARTPPGGETPARVVGRPTAPLHEAAPPNRLVAPEEAPSARGLAEPTPPAAAIPETPAPSRALELIGKLQQHSGERMVFTGVRAGNIDQALRYVALDEMKLKIPGKFDILERAQLLNIRDNLKALLSGAHKSIAGVTATDMRNTLGWNRATGVFEIKNHAALEGIIQKLQKHASAPEMVEKLKRGAAAYINNLSQDEWKKMLEAKFPATTPTELTQAAALSRPDLEVVHAAEKSVFTDHLAQSGIRGASVARVAAEDSGTLHVEDSGTHAPHTVEVKNWHIIAVDNHPLEHPLDLNEQNVHTAIAETTGASGASAPSSDMSSTDDEADAASNDEAMDAASDSTQYALDALPKSGVVSATQLNETLNLSGQSPSKQIETLRALLQHNTRHQRLVRIVGGKFATLFRDGNNIYLASPGPKTIGPQLITESNVSGWVKKLLGRT